MERSRYKIIESGKTYFITSSVINWLSLFALPALTGTIEYIHYNPVKRGYVDKPEHWRYSSSRDYIGLKGLVAVKPLV